MAVSADGDHDMVRSRRAGGGRTGVGRGSEKDAGAKRTPGPATAVLTFGALGVVYGDIGTNPLFAIRDAFTAHDLRATESNVLGLLSLMFWALILVITVKYLTFVRRADNDGEGGILALIALVPERRRANRRARRALLLLGCSARRS